MNKYDGRLRILSLSVILFAVLLLGKLYTVQIVHGERFSEKAAHQYTSGENYFDRGTIYFSPKDGTLVRAATVKTGYILSINPELLSKNGVDTDELFKKLSAITPIDREAYDKKINKTNDPYEELAKRLPSEIKDEIEKLQIKGVALYQERWRIYPANSMAAHTLGFIGYKGDELAGRYGLERFYEKTLKRDGDDAFVNFFAEIFSNIEKTLSDDKTLEGNIVTTIEPGIEAYLEEELSKVNSAYSSDFTGGIVIDPKTGEIYAMALTPTFDPNNLQNETDAGIFRNKLVEDRYEMGSIVKPIAMAAALDAGAVTRRTTYSDPGCITLNSRTFCNYDLKSHGSAVTMQQVLNKSLNTGMAFATKRLGNKNLADYMFKFGFDEVTGIDLPNEGKSLVSNLSVNRDLEAAQASFGQGIALTPIQTVRALSVLANGGYLITPHIAKEIEYKIGGKDTFVYEKGAQVLKPETSEEISRMLTEVVDTALRGGTVKFLNYSVAAKTGTAQIAKEGGGGYYEDKYLHSFFGYFPSYDPKFLVFLYTYDPKGVQYASETLTDTFINMAKFLINYYEIAPDREAPPEPLS